MKYLFIYLSFLFLFNNSSLQKSNKKPFVEFKATTVSFDSIKAGAPIKGIFIFNNTGDMPLIITNVQASDGGTIAEWPVMPVIPGATDTIKVQLHTQGRRGAQDKLFNVISNAENDPVMLHWNGFVISN
jgi:hypothetical protein